MHIHPLLFVLCRDLIWDDKYILFKGHVIIEESKIIKSFSSSNTPAVADYSVFIDGSKIGGFLTHFWRSAGFWYVAS